MPEKKPERNSSFGELDHIEEVADPEEEMLEDRTAELSTELRVSSQEVDSAALPPLKEKEIAHEEYARRIYGMLKDGMPFDEAVLHLGARLPGGAKTAFRGMVFDLISKFHLPDVVARETVRAARNKLLLENLGPGGDRKIALEAAKQIAADPDVGLTAPPAPPVQINIGEGLRKILESDSSENMADIFEE